MPCDTCPYRRSTPVGIWDPAEYENLQRQDADPFGSTFGCHKDAGKERPAVCRGWLADQKRRGVPSMRLRLQLARDPALQEQFEAVDENDPDLYSSIAEMSLTNSGAMFPERSPKARLLREKLARRVRP